jgi:mRNA interferase HigB
MWFASDMLAGATMSGGRCPPSLSCREFHGIREGWSHISVGHGPTSEMELPYAPGFSRCGAGLTNGQFNGVFQAVRIISRKVLVDFWNQRPDCEQTLRSWYVEVKKARWRSHLDVTIMFPSARAIGANRIIFKIKGNTYRLIVSVHYQKEIVYVRFLGTHSEYDRIDALTV